MAIREKDISILVAVDVSSDNEINQVAQQLQRAGMLVEDVLPLTGTIIGSANRGQLSQFESIPHVVAVEEDAIFEAMSG